MWRMLAVVVAASLCGLGCGAGGRVEPLDLRGCPSGKDIVRATDVIGKPPPKGYVIDPGDKQRLKQIADQFKTTVGDSWRGYDARVLVRRKQVNGTAVIVINSDDKTTGRNDLIRGAEAGAKQAGQEAKPVTIAGQEGRILQTSDGAYIAMAPTDRCAVVLLLADREQLIRDAANVIPTP
jgi:hypothetical protein